MVAELLAALVDDRPGPRHVRLLLRNERGVVPGRDEADLLAVWLVGHVQPKPSRLVTHLRLGEASHREPRARQLRLREREEKIRLILLAIRAALQQPSSILAPLDLRV